MDSFSPPFPLRNPRDRGGRGPQVGPHTFDVRNVQTDPITAIVWSPGPGFPATELWCFKSGGAGPYHQVASGDSLFIQMVPDADGFAPPNPSDPLGNDEILATRDALKAYAARRLWTLQSAVPPNTADWTVQAFRPHPAPADSASRKIVGDIPTHAEFHGFIYKVTQMELNSSEPVAWVWVAAHDDSAGPANPIAPFHEVWISLRPLESVGMRVVGMPVGGSQSLYAKTHLKFDVAYAVAAPARDLHHLGTSIKNITEKLFTDADCAATSPDDLIVHDYRIQTL
jgi:hypothetical protein